MNFNMLPGPFSAVIPANAGTQGSGNDEKGEGKKERESKPGSPGSGFPLARE
jgi:hypothetical protein